MFAHTEAFNGHQLLIPFYIPYILLASSQQN